MTICLIWAIGLVFSLPFLIFATYDPSFNPHDSLNETNHLITICQLNANSSTARACITWFIVVLIFIPFFVLIFIYARIILELARHRAIRLTEIAKTQQQQQQQSYDEDTNSLSGGLSSNSENQPSHSFLAYKRFEQKRLNTVIICVVTVAFFACQFPVRIIQLIDMYARVRNEETMPHITWIWLWKLSKLLFFLNFTANPVGNLCSCFPAVIIRSVRFLLLDYLQYFINEISSIMSTTFSHSSFVQCSVEYFT